MTDAERVDEIRDYLQHHPQLTMAQFLLTKLDATNQTIAEYTDYIKDYELMLDQRDCTIRSNVKQIRDLQRQVSNLTSAYSNRVDKYVRVEQERDDYKVTLKLMSENDHHLSRRYMELATQTLSKHAPRQEEAK